MPDEVLKRNDEASRWFIDALALLLPQLLCVINALLSILRAW